jgi:hypothetical protein
MKPSARIKDLSGGQVLALAFRCFQVADTFMGISKPMDAAQMSVRAEQAKMLAEMLTNMPWLRVSVLGEAVKKAATKSEISNASPALFAKFFEANRDDLRKKSADPVEPYAQLAAPLISDTEWLQKMGGELANLELLDGTAQMLHETLIAQVYFNALSRLGLVDYAEYDHLLQEITAQLPADWPNRPPRGRAALFEYRNVKSDAVRLAKVAYCKKYHKENPDCH